MIQKTVFYKLKILCGGVARSCGIEGWERRCSERRTDEAYQIVVYHHGHVWLVSSNFGLVAGIRDCGQGPVESPAQGLLSVGPLAQRRKGPGAVTPVCKSTGCLTAIDLHQPHPVIPSSLLEMITQGERRSFSFALLTATCPRGFTLACRT